MKGIIHPIGQIIYGCSSSLIDISTGNGVPLSGLTEFAPQFESQGSRFCWENMCLPVRAGTSSLGCGTDLKVPPTVGALPRIPRD